MLPNWKHRCLAFLVEHVGQGAGKESDGSSSLVCPETLHYSILIVAIT